MAIFPEAHEFGPQLFLLVIYCYFIFNGSKLIATGCEALREIYGSGIVGSLILPVLGAVPDGIIIVFSLLGDHGTPEGLAEAISVGVGQLCGATCLLITIPLCVSIFLGSRKIDPQSGLAMSEYKPISKASNKLILKPVLPTEFSLWGNGITSLPSTPKSIIWMLITSCTYLFVQLPAVFMHSDADQGAHRERYFIFMGFIVATLLFMAYLYAMSRDDDNDHLVEERRQRGNKFLKWTRENRSLISSLDPVTLFNLLDTNRDGFLSAEDIQTGFKLLGFHDISNADALAIFNLADQDNDVLVDLEEWSAFVREFILVNETQPLRRKDQLFNSAVLTEPTTTNFNPLLSTTSGANVDSADYTDDLNSSTIKMRTPIKTPRHLDHQDGSGTSYASPSYIDETNQLWNVNRPTSKNIFINTEKLGPSQPLLSTPQNAGSYRGASSFFASTGAPQQLAVSGNLNGSIRGEPPKFIRLEPNNIPPSPSTMSGHNNSQRDLFVSSTTFLTNPAPSQRANINAQTNLFSDYHQMNHGITEDLVILYEDPNRSEEPISNAQKQQIPPPIPPDVMSSILRWYLDPQNSKVAVLKVGNKMRWALHLWAKRTRKLGHYSYTLENGERALKLIKLDPHTHHPVHGRKRAESKAFVGLDIGDSSGSLRNSTTTGHHDKHRTVHFQNQAHSTHAKTIFDSASAVYHQEVWGNLDLPRWCYASPQIHQWYLSTVAAMKKNADSEGSLNAIDLDTPADSPSTSPGAPDVYLPSGDELQMPPLLQLFKLADKDLSKSLSFDDVDRFAIEWGLYQHDINKQVLQVIFYNIDIDYDRSLAVFDFRTFLEEFVKLPQIGTVLLKKAAGSKKRNHPGRIYTQKECDQWQDDVEDKNDALNEKEQKEIEHYAFCYHLQEYLGVDDREHKLLFEHEDNAGLTPQQILAKQERMHKFLGYGSLILGTSLILLFSDPLIEIVTALGASSGIPAFYISFVVLPFVSNSSELITSLLFAREKTSTSIALTLSSLYGAAIMNNTFCVAIFMLLLFIKNLPWIYSAEIIVTITVQLIVGFITYRVTLRQLHALICAAIFPLAVFSIWFLENVAGLKEW